MSEENETLSTAINSEDLDTISSLLGDDEVASEEPHGDLVLKDVPAIDQIPHMIRLLAKGNDSQRKRLCEVIFNILCCYVGDGIFTEFGTDRSHVIHEAAAVKMLGLMKDDAVLGKEYFREQFYQYLPENSWSDFKIYFDVLASEGPTQKERDAKKNVDEAKLALRHFGEKVWERFKDIRTRLNTWFNPHWKAAILEKSGSTPSKVFYAIREWAYETFLDKKAEASLKAAIKYQKTQRKQGKPVVNEIDFDLHPRDYYLAERRKMCCDKDPGPVSFFSVGLPRQRIIIYLR